MTYAKSALLALATVCALSSPVLAQGEGGKMTNGSIMVIMADGRTHARMMTDQPMIDSMVKQGKPLAAGQIVVMSGGKMYVVDDHKMADGKMMSEVLMSTK